MTDVKISTYITGIIIFSMMIMGVIALISIFRSADSTFIDDGKFADFNETFNTLDDVSTSVGGLKDGIVDSDTDWGVFGVLNSLLGTMWNSVVLIFESFDFMNSVFNGLSTFFGIPTWVTGLISLLVIVLIVFGIYNLISGNSS